MKILQNQLVSVAEQTRLNLTCSSILKTGFQARTVAQIYNRISLYKFCIILVKRRLRQAYASAQSDQHLNNSLPVFHTKFK